MSVTPFVDKLAPVMNLNLMDEMPCGCDKVMNKSERVNRDESPDCSDHYNLCPISTKRGNCEGGNGEKESMKLNINCAFSWKSFDKNNFFTRRSFSVDDDNADLA